MRRIINGILQNWGTQGSAWGASTVVTVGVSGASQYVAIPQGVWFVQTDAHSLVKVTYDGGSFGTSGHFVTWLGTGTNGMVYSDGFSTFMVGDGSAIGSPVVNQITPLA